VLAARARALAANSLVLATVAKICPERRTTLASLRLVGFRAAFGSGVVVWVRRPWAWVGRSGEDVATTKQVRRHPGSSVAASPFQRGLGPVAGLPPLPRRAFLVASSRRHSRCADHSSAKEHRPVGQ
jgi:hypothetical protein